MKKTKISRRQILAAGSVGAIGTIAGLPFNSYSIGSSQQRKLALLGGEKVHKGSWPTWPVWNRAAEKDIAEMYRTGRWFYGVGEHVADFEKLYAELVGSRRCVSTSSGTTALLTSLFVSGVDAGDEVIISPYTFIATYNVVLQQKALPVFADTDPETILIDPKTIEGKITDRTSAIIPVHIYGYPCEMDTILNIAKKHNLKVVEDACQAWFAEYKGKKTGTWGDAGCFSFQNSKNLPAGEGGAITTNNDEFADRCWSFRNVGRSYGKFKDAPVNSFRGTNYRMQQVQALVLMSQLPRVKPDDQVRQANAKYLNAKLKDIPGIVPYKMTDPSNISALHVFPFRFIQEKFGNVPKAQFLQALNAEGIPAGVGYGPQNKDGLFEEAFASKGFKRLFSEARLKQWKEENLNLPGNDQVCKEVVTFGQNVLLGSRQDMDDIINAVTKVYENRASILA